MTAALDLGDVTVNFAGRRRAAPVAALRGVSCKIGAGERVAIVGRSGAGKSTIARLACGLVRPTSGSVKALGSDVGNASNSELRALRRRMHLVFQDPYQSLHPGMRVEGIVGEPLAIAGNSTGASEQVSEALTSVGLAPASQFLHRTPGSLSGGQRQRVAMARALVARPELILADEPTSMLDASLGATIANLVLALQEEHSAALVFITHNLALARQVAERIIVLADGVIVEDRPTEELLADPQHPETQRLLAAARHRSFSSSSA